MGSGVSLVLWPPNQEKSLGCFERTPALPGSGPGPRLGDEVPARGPGRGAHVQVKLVYAFDGPQNARSGFYWIKSSLSGN